ncbi:hypothetical protein PRK78_006829 [Emydomyces testavorans]|uniref:Xylanolytic transcriptional activator regulatory domain-containing protein n=1 Tax=Emydomyces testavorans TaxID=2070801 RepID=A0AAF0DN48_9EURO|nr:hypothetical protein PRK78_006829 [Emydomyces testavorans]
MIAGAREVLGLVLGYTLYYISQHPRAQERLRKELADIQPTLNHSNSAAGDFSIPDITALDKLPYLSAVIQESLRLRPNSTPLPRITPSNQAVTLVDVPNIPPGTRINAFQWFLHRDPAKWSKVDQWIPERWLEETVENKGNAEPKTLWAFGILSPEELGMKAKDGSTRVNASRAGLSSEVHTYLNQQAGKVISTLPSQASSPGRPITAGEPSHSVPETQRLVVAAPRTQSDTDQGSGKLGPDFSVIPASWFNGRHHPTEKAGDGHFATPDQRIATPGLAHLQEECELLELLREFSLFEKLIDVYWEVSEPSVIARPLIASALPHVRAYLEEYMKTGNYLALLQKVSDNITRPWRVPESMTATEFYTLFAGESLRWEFIGTIFAISGLAALLVSQQHPIFAEKGGEFEQASFVRDMVAASNNCVAICQRRGDSDYIVWRRLGEISTDIFALGWHSPQDSAPFFLTESRKRLFASAYRSDKSLASFLGRPPRIPKRYCTIAMPLDLNDDDLMKREAELDSILASLDSNGWSIDKSLKPAAWIRLRFQLSTFKEDILELSLGPEQDRTVETLSAISQNSSPQLHDVSMQILEMVMTLTRQWNHMEEVRKNFSWIFLFYGFSSAAVLLTELRKRSQNKSSPVEYDNTCYPSRSEIIRKTCALISFTDVFAFSDTDGNHKLCKDAIKKLEKIINDILDHNSSSLCTAGDRTSARDLIYHHSDRLCAAASDCSQQGTQSNSMTPDLFNASDDALMNSGSTIEGLPLQSDFFSSWIDTIDWGDYGILPAI